MAEMENQLRDSTEFMSTVSRDLIKAVEPVVGIEKTLDDAAKQMGSMSDDPFFHLKRRVCSVCEQRHHRTPHMAKQSAGYGA